MAKKDDEKKEDEFYLTQPTTVLDLEERYAAEEDDSEEEPDPGRSYAVEDNDTSAYVAVSPEYMTYADETHKPMRAEEGPEAEAEKRGLEGLNKNSVMAATSGSAVMDAAVETSTIEDDARRTREGMDDENKAAAKEQKAADRAAAKESESTTTSRSAGPAPA